MDIDYTYQLFELTISIFRIMDVINSDRFMDIYNSNYGYH